MYRLFFIGLLALPLEAVALAAPPTAAASALARQAVTFELDAVSQTASTWSRTAGWSFWATGADMRLRAGADTVRVRLEGADASAPAQGTGPARRVSQYFTRRQDTLAGRVSPHFGQVRFLGVYKGINLLYYGRDGDLEYDFELEAAAEPGAIVLAFDRAVEIRGDGALAIPTNAGELIQRAPAAFQGEIPVEVRYRKVDERRIGFEIGEYDRTRALRIDPRVGLASFFGASGSDRIEAVTFDSKGAMWIAGQTNSPDLPLPLDGFPSQRRGASDVFASKFVREVSAAGEESWRLTTTLFLVGAGRDRAAGVSVDSVGRVYLFGDTQSRDFPISNNAEQRDLAGGADGFVTILRESDFPFFFLNEEEQSPQQGAFTSYEMEYSTLIGGAGDDAASQGFVASFAEDRGLPCAILAGQSSSTDLPTTTFAVQERNGGGTDAFFSVLCRREGEGYPLTYGTFFGGGREEAGAAMAVAASGSFCLATRTTSSGLGATGLQLRLSGSTEAYFACYEPIRRRFGLPFLYRELGSTFWGGSAGENLADIAIQETGAGPADFRLFVLADSVSIDLAQASPTAPMPSGAAAGNPGSRSLLVGAFPPSLDRTLAQFWLGGRSQDLGANVEVSGDCIAVAGTTESADFPASLDFPERAPDRGSDIAVGKFCFDAAMTAAETVYLGAYGSSGNDTATAVTAGPFGDEVAAGWTLAPAGPPPTVETTPAALQSSYGGGQEDGLLVELYRPRIRAESVVGAADYLSRPIAPGQIVTIFGPGIGPGSLIGPQLDGAGRLRRELGGVRVLFDGEPAPLIFVSRNQVSAVAPFFLEVRSGVRVQIETDGSLSEPVTLPVAPTAPAVFTLSQTGSGQAAVLNEDSSVNGQNRPASPGSLLQIFLTGAGQTLPRGVDGELIPPRQPFPQIVAPVAVRIGGVEATLLYAGGAPGQVHGVAQINVLTPRGLPGDPQTPLEITIGGQSIQTGVTVAIAAAP